MFPWKKDLSRRQVNFTKGIINTCDYIIIHHTGTKPGTLRGNIIGLTGTNDDGSIHKTSNPVSAHFLIDSNGDAYKLADPTQVTWHAGLSNWGNLTGMNYHGLGIEVIGPPFTGEQRKTVRDLIQHLMAVFKIPKERVLRHCDLTHLGSRKMQLWDGKSRNRKVDISDSFWKIDRTTWKEYQDSFIPKKQ